MPTKPAESKERAPVTERGAPRWLSRCSRHGPMLPCAIATILVFVLFMVEGIVAIIVHNEWILHATMAFHAVAIFVLSLNCIWLVCRCCESFHHEESLSSTKTTWHSEGQTDLRCQSCQHHPYKSVDYNLVQHPVSPRMVSSTQPRRAGCGNSGRRNDATACCSFHFHSEKRGFVLGGYPSQ